MPRGPRVGVLGGTFDPFHNGHLVAAAAARHQLGLDRVLLVVANRPWQKEGARTITSAADRVALTAVAVEGVEGLEVSTVEVDRGGPTYTVETIEALRGVHQAGELFLVVGGDVAAELQTWHRVDEVRAQVTLAVVARARATSAELSGWRTARIDMPQLDISSTDIRRRVRDREPIDGLVAPSVVREIQARGLYAHG